MRSLSMKRIALCTTTVFSAISLVLSIVAVHRTHAETFKHHHRPPFSAHVPHNPGGDHGKPHCNEATPEHHGEDSDHEHKHPEPKSPENKSAEEKEKSAES